MLESFYNKEQLYHKETPTQVFSCEICKILKNNDFEEHLQWLLLEILVLESIFSKLEFSAF